MYNFMCVIKWMGIFLTDFAYHRTFLLTKGIEYVLVLIITITVQRVNRGYSLVFYNFSVQVKNNPLPKR
jgi:hypothetical protein